MVSVNEGVLEGVAADFVLLNHGGLDRRHAVPERLVVFMGVDPTEIDSKIQNIALISHKEALSSVLNVFASGYLSAMRR